MTAPPTHVERFALVTRALAVLADHPDGILLADLAAHIDTTGDELADEIAAYYACAVTVDHLGGGYREPLIEFIAAPGGPNGAAQDLSPVDSAYVRLRDLRPAAGVGAWFLSFGQLATVTAAGRRLLAEERANAPLTAALNTAATAVLAGAAPSGAAWPEIAARRIRRAGAERRRVRIAYAMAWKAGTIERVIEPYRVIRTRRGWEVDAAVTDRDGALTTMVTSNVRSLEVLPERFRRPADIDLRIERHRRIAEVDLVVPHAHRWAVELHAESIDVLDEAEDRLVIRARIAPPVGPRLGLVLLAAGPQARVIDPVNLQRAGRELARALLTHHGGQ